MKKNLVLLIICFLLTGCAEKFEVYSTKTDDPYLTADINYINIKNYPDFSENINTFIKFDFEKYADFAKEDWLFDNTSKSTYRNEILNYSNGRYLNFLVKKFVWAGENIEDEYDFMFCYDKINHRKLESIEEATGVTVVELRDYCKASLKKSLLPMNLSDYENQMIELGLNTNLTTDLSKYKNFSMDRKNVTIWFAPDEVIPKGWGIQKVVIPRKR